MKNKETQRTRFRYAPEKNISIAFVDFLLIVAGFLLTAAIVRGTWRLSSTARRAAEKIREVSCTEVPPYFWTISIKIPSPQTMSQKGEGCKEKPPFFANSGFGR